MSYAGPPPIPNSLHAFVQSAKEMVSDLERARTDYTNLQASSNQQLLVLQNENQILKQSNS